MNLQLLSKYRMSASVRETPASPSKAPEGRVSAAPPPGRDRTLHVMSCYLQQIRWMEKHGAKRCRASPGARGPRSMKQVKGAIAGQ